MNNSTRICLGIALFLTSGEAAELTREATNAWDQYLQSATAQVKTCHERQTGCPWVETTPDAIAKLKNREVLVSGVGGTGRISVPHGLIHDWTAAVFIPNTTLDRVLSLIQDYDNYWTWYPPTVVESRLLSSTANERKFELRLVRKAFLVTAAFEIESEARFYRTGKNRAYSIASSTRVREIENYGKPEQRILAPDTGSGYVWRSATISQYEERDGGVFLELRALLLSREISSSSAWFVKPLVSRMARSALTVYLERTRRAVMSSGGTSTAKE